LNDPDPDVGEPLIDGDGDGDAEEGDGATEEGTAGAVGALVVGGTVVGGGVAGLGGNWLGVAVAARATPAVPPAGRTPPATAACTDPLDTPAWASPAAGAPITITMAASGSTRRTNLAAIGPPLTR
jgi:hypothetical protein